MSGSCQGSGRSAGKAAGKAAAAHLVGSSAGQLARHLARQLAGQQPRKWSAAWQGGPCTETALCCAGAERCSRHYGRGQPGRAPGQAAPPALDRAPPGHPVLLAHPSKHSRLLRATVPLPHSSQSGQFTRLLSACPLKLVRPVQTKLLISLPSQASTAASLKGFWWRQQACPDGTLQCFPTPLACTRTDTHTPCHK